MNERQLTLHTPKLSGPEALLVQRIQGHEGLSTLFTYDVTFHARSENVDFDAILGQEMCLGLSLPGGKERFFHGYVASFANVGSTGEFQIYQAQLRPHLWRLTRAVNCRIFQNEPVLDIVLKVLEEHGIKGVETHLGGGTRGPYLPWEYCVQYRESDFAFISRLLEHEGIHYWFQHEQSSHKLVLADHNFAHEAAPGYEQVEYTRAVNMQNRRQECVWSWRERRSVLHGRHSARDFDFTKPRADLGGSSGSEVERKHDKALPEDYEIYDYLETVVQQTGYSAQLLDDYARVRTEEAHVQYAVISADTDARGLCAGAVLKLFDGPTRTHGQSYLIVSTAFSAENDARSSSSAPGHAPVYACSLQAIDMKHPFRPARVTPKPIISGPQSAVVAGKAGQDFWTDQWGRVRVKFHWDRAGKGDESSSCWVRVSQQSAGTTWGSMFVPHLGQEVLVGFLEGDPDRPVVVGRVYNGSNKPPLNLPDHAYKSIIRDFYGNEIVMDSTPGKEHMAFYSPSHTSSLRLGKSVEKFTTSGDKTYSYDSESYHFGKKYSWTKGSTISIDRGLSLVIKAGAGVSATVGAEVRVSASSSFEAKAGFAITYMHGANISWGFSREFKKTKGTYKRVSEKEAVLDSQLRTIICGGKNDNTMLVSDDKKLTLSYDSDTSGRSGDLAQLDSMAKIGALAMATLTSGVAGLGAWAYQFEADKARKGKWWDPEDKKFKINLDSETVSSFGASDIPLGIAAVGAALSARTGVGSADIAVPEHKSPSSQVMLAMNTVRIFGGKKKETELNISAKQGFTAVAKKNVLVESKDSGISIRASKVVTLKAGDSVTVDSVLKHRNLQVLE